MKRICLLLVLSLNVCLLFAAKQEILLNSIVSGTFLSASIPEIRSMQNARFYTCIDDSGKKLIRYSYTSGKQEEIILDVDNAKGAPLKKILGYAFSPNETKILVWSEKKPIYRHSFTTDFQVYDRKRNLLEPLSETGSQRDAKFSPDSRSIAFSRENNLFIKRLDFGTEIAVTSDGEKNSIINGVADWVYEEEFAETCAFDWSGDSKFLAYVKFNEKTVPTYTMPLFGVVQPGKNSYYPGSYSYKYPSAGSVNSTVSIFAFSLQTRSAKQMIVPIADEDYIPRIRFTRYNNQLVSDDLEQGPNCFQNVLFQSEVRSKYLGIDRPKRKICRTDVRCHTIFD